MAYQNLGEFLDRLDASGELQRVPVEVDPYLEIAEIVDRVSKQPDGGKALFFERVKGSDFPLVVNIFGSLRRVCLALCIEEPAELMQRMARLLARLPGENSFTRLDVLTQHMPGDPAPQRLKQIPCQEVLDFEPDLDRCPGLTCWPDDAGPSLTLPMVFSSDPESGRSNCGMYRVQILGRNTAAIHWQPGSDGAGHYASYVARGARMPVAIAMGGDPAQLYAATLPLPGQIDEMVFAGMLKDHPVELVECLTSALKVPANAEMVLEGYLEPGEIVRGGVFGNHTGFYTPAPDAPVLHVTCISRRERPVIPATVIGRPPMEDCWLAKITERLMLPFIRLQLPEVVDISLLLEGIYHNCAVVAINKAYPGHAAVVMKELRTGTWLRKARLLVVVDADMDVRNISKVFWRALNFVDSRQDLLIDGFMGIDATRKWPAERDGHEWPREIVMDGTVIHLVDRRWHEYGV